MTERRPFDPAELVGEVRPAWDAARVERALDAQLRAARRRLIVRSVSATLAFAAILALAWRAWPTAPPLATHDAVSPASFDAPRDDTGAIELADGSRFTPLSGGELTMHEVTEARVRAALTAGAVDVDIVPRPGREVRIEVGLVTVTVLGTAFRITRHDDAPDGPQVEVAVVRGRVAVDYAEGGGAHRRTLGAGESGVFPPTSPSIEETIAPEAVPADHDDTDRGDGERVREDRDETAPAEVIVTTTSWRELAERGDFDEAYSALDGAGPAAAPRDLEELLLAADAARLSGHPHEALTFLERAESSATGDARAPLAAFSAGRILAQLGRHTEAAERFERVLALEPGGSLAEDAMVRAAEAHDRAGHHDAARALAERYLATHPDGRGAARMRALAR